jgi:ribosomal protein S27E
MVHPSGVFSYSQTFALLKKRDQMHKEFMYMECKRCGDDVEIPLGWDETKWCDECAQVVAENLFTIATKLLEWDKAHPKGRIYPIGPNDAEKQLDALFEEVRLELSISVGAPKSI